MDAGGSGARLGAYRLLERLGRGGMGEVWRALDERAGRQVALKVLARELATTPEAAERFRREALAAGTLAHPNVATLFFAGEDAGRTFLVFELVPGGTLEDRLRRAGPLPWRAAARLGAQLASGLAAVHSAGFVHRDLKPANVLLDLEGRPKLADFGLARPALTRGEVERLTQTGELVGTLEYMAPEQANGAAVDPRADLYGLGATLHAAIAGTPPFRGSGYALVKKVVAEPAPRLRSLVPDVPPALEALVLRLLAKEPGERGEGAASVARELAALADAAPAPSAARVRWPLVAGAALALAGLGGGLALAWTARSRAPAPASSPAASPSSSPAPRASASPRVATTTAPVTSAGYPDASPETRALLAKASAAAELKLWKEAREAAEEVALSEPRNAVAVARLAQALLGLGKVEEARDEAGRAVRLDPDVGFARYVLGQVEESAGSKDEALHEYTQALARDNALFHAWASRAGIERDRHDLESAERDLDRAIALEPAAWALMLRGAVRRDRGELDLALEDLRRAVALWPKSQIFHDKLAEVLALHGDLREALAECERALELDPGFTIAANRARELRAKLRGAARDPEVQKLLDGAESLADENRWPELQDVARAVLARDPANPLGLARLAQALLGLGKKDEARVAAARAVELGPDLGLPWYVLGYVKHSAGDAAGALPDYDRALERDPTVRDAWVERCKIERERHEYTKALRDVESALALAPGNAGLIYTRGLTRRDLGDLRGAREDLSRALALLPDQSRWRVKYADVLEKLGDFGAAVEQWEKLVARDPKNADYAAHLEAARAKVAPAGH